MAKLPEVTDEQWELVDKWNRKLVEEFLKQSHLSPQTLMQYKSALRQFFKWVYDECDNKQLYKLKPRHALQYQNFLIDAGLSPSAVRFKRSAVSSLCGYVEVYYSDEDGCETFRNIYSKKIPNPAKSNKKEKKPLTVDEYELLIETMKKRKDWQKVAYLEFVYVTGCRRGETGQLLKEVVNYPKLKDKEGNEKNLWMTHQIRCKGKGREGKVRKFTIDKRVMDAIRKWLEVRGEDNCPYVFINTKAKEPKPLHPSSFNNWCKIFGEIIGRHVHPHMFRSTRATHMKEAGVDIKKIQKHLGHESSTTTEIYIVSEDVEDFDGIYEE